MEVSTQLHALVVFPEVLKYLVLDGSRTGLEALEKTKIFAVLWNERRFFGRLAQNLDAIPTTLSRLL